MFYGIIINRITFVVNSDARVLSAQKGGFGDKQHILISVNRSVFFKVFDVCLVAIFADFSLVCVRIEVVFSVDVQTDCPRPPKRTTAITDSAQEH